MALRCLIVDDNGGFRDVARSLLEREAIEVVGVASNAAVGCETSSLAPTRAAAGSDRVVCVPRLA